MGHWAGDSICPARKPRGDDGAGYGGGGGQVAGGAQDEN